MYEPRSQPNTRRSQKKADVLYGDFHAESEAKPTELDRYIPAAASPKVAARYTDSIVTYCESLQSLPRRVLIAFEVDADPVAILGVFYGGQDYETCSQGENDGEG